MGQTIVLRRLSTCWVKGVDRRYYSHMRALTVLLLCTAALAQPKAGEWQSMFDGKTLQGWRETAFTDHGKVRVENGTVVLAAGASLPRGEP